MSEIIRIEENDWVRDKIILIRNQHVILDRDVAELYGVETKRINEAVSNNPEKFPQGYTFELSEDELAALRSKISTLKKGRGQHSKHGYKAFTEKGLYMLATILKSQKATQTTLAIVETYASIREFSRTLSELAETKEEEKQKALMQKGGEIISDILGENMRTTDTETTVELNFAVLKVKHTVKRKEDKSKESKK